MKKIFTFLGIAVLAMQGAFALITVPASFPSNKVNGQTATQKDQLALLVARYQNDVVLLVNSASDFSSQVQNIKANPATMEKLKALATTGGNGLTADSLAAAVTALTRQNPADAAVIAASALELLKGVPAGQSPENRLLIARAAINGLPDNLNGRGNLIALIIGVTADDLAAPAVADLVKAAREFAIADVPQNQQADMALAVDEALLDLGVVSSFTAAPEFLALVDNFAESQLQETFFSGDQGVISQGAVFSPGATGSAGGSGNTGNQVEPPPAS
jgi:hypothetical protein